MPTANLIRTSTYGWDTVYAIRFTELNKAIASQNTSPKELEASKVDEGDAYRIKGTFGTWQLTTGGDGRNVRLAVPITTSTFTAGGQSYSLTAVTLVVQVSLEWVNTGQQNGAATYELYVANGAGATVAVLPNLTDLGTNDLGEALRAVYALLVQEWLAQHISSFQQVFSTVNINKQLVNNKTGFQWIVPTSVPFYAVTDGDDGDLATSLFGVLCMTENRPAPRTHQLDPYAIPADATSAFLISPERVLANMLRPGIGLLFLDKPGSDQFDISPDGLTLTNQNALQFADQELDNGTQVQPRINAGNFSLEMRDNRIDMRLDGLYFEYSPGITVTITHSASASLGVTSTNHFKMDVVGTSLTSATITSSTGVLVAQIVGGIAAAVAGAIVGGLLGAWAEGGEVAIENASTRAALNPITGGAIESGSEEMTNLAAQTLEQVINVGRSASFSTFFAGNWGKLLVSIIGGIAGGAAAVIPSIINYLANDKASEIPTLDEFGQQALAPVVWPTAKNYQLKGGQLNGPLQLRIEVTF